MITAAALCPGPPLLARELTGADPVVPDLREACRQAVAGLLASRPELVAVVGAAEQTADWDPAGRLDLAPYAPVLGRSRPAGGPPLPLPLGLGTDLLDQAGYSGPRVLQSVSPDEPPAECAKLGADLAGRAARVALLVMADGSARRGRRAPGYLDERSAPFDAEVERAVRDGDLDALLAVDPVLARELMATGRPAWQVLAGAMAGSRPRTEIQYAGDPFGVYYLVATLKGIQHG
jgi:hypothetical protein